ncbi:MAG: DNA replication and repair protein RecF [Oscillospiraceae bacterium]|jgi:DNA replication and repair protein RecF|nr:DNA replication and repair protein RecF [Oscillospiraceae bacterium]
MHILTFQLNSFRNLARVEIKPSAGVNVIFGENGQGKTSLLEAIWLFTGCRSFRCADAAEMVKEHEAQANLQTSFISNGREQAASLEIAKRRALTLNGFPQETPRRMLGVFPAVAFTPDTLSLVKGGPGERRRFLDVALSMLTPAYAVRLSKYLKALAQRNALLRQPNPPEDLLNTWDSSLAKEAAGILSARLNYLGELIPRAMEFYRNISGAREALGIVPHITGADEPTEGSYLAAFARTRQNDLRRQMTTAGPHRDDLHLTLDNRPLRDFGSQGQQRSAARALRLAEAAALGGIAREAPAALLDDVRSELDARRQADLLKYLEGWQVFLTCCEPSHALHGRAGKVFHVTNGEIVC